MAKAQEEKNIVKETADRKFETPQFKQYLKERRGAAIWDIVLYAISLICILIVFLSPCIEINLGDGYEYYMRAMRTEILQETKEDSNKSKTDNQLIDGNRRAYSLIIQLATELENTEDSDENLDMAISIAILTDIAICSAQSDEVFENYLAQRVAEYSKINKKYNVVQFSLKVLEETAYKNFTSGSKGIFTLRLVGIIFSVHPIMYILSIVMLLMGGVASVVNIVAHKKIAKKTYMNLTDKKFSFSNGNFVMYLPFFIIYIISKFITPAMRDPVYMFLSAVKVTPLFFVILAVELVVLILSMVNSHRKKNLYNWLKSH